MSAVRTTGTALELSTHGILRELGLRFRRNVRGLPGYPDIVLRDCAWPFS